MAQKTLKRYETDAYDFCDALDYLATRKGTYIADRAVSCAMRDLFEDYPEVLKQFEPHVVARHKAIAKIATTYKQASADEFDRLGVEFAMALRDAAQQPGGSAGQVVKWAQNVIAQASSKQGLGGATKEARNSFDTMMSGVSDHIVQTGGIQKP